MHVHDDGKDRQALKHVTLRGAALAACCGACCGACCTGHKGFRRRLQRLLRNWLLCRWPLLLLRQRRCRM